MGHKHKKRPSPLSPSWACFSTLAGLGSSLERIGEWGVHATHSSLVAGEHGDPTTKKIRRKPEKAPRNLPQKRPDGIHPPPQELHVAIRLPHLERDHVKENTPPGPPAQRRPRGCVHWNFIVRKKIPAFPELEEQDPELGETGLGV